MQRALSWTTVAVLAAIVALPAGAQARVPDAVAAATCSKETKRLKTFQRGMKAAKRRFFRTHRSAKARKRFVKQQKRTLAQLKRARKRCLAKPPAGSPPAQPAPPAPPAPPPAAAPAPLPAPPPPAPLATTAIADVVSAAAEFAPAEVATENQVEYVRTQLELELAPDATVAQMEALLAQLGAEVVSSLEGVGVLTVRVPDPGSLDALRALAAGLAGTTGLARADLVTVPAPTELPDIISTSDVSPVRPQLASRAGAAWNVRGALTGGSRPTLVIGDFFGAGPPGPEVAVQETASDFATNNPLAHGYTILGLAAATFEPGAVPGLAVDQVTGMWAGPDIPLRVVDLRRSIAGSTAQDRLLQVIRGLSGDVVINTSFEDGCARAGCTAAQIQADARQWIRRVRESFLEGRFLHVSAAGNIYPDLLTDTQAALGAAFNAAALTPPPGVAPLENTIVVENATASDPANGPVVPLCLTATSKRGGHISAVGNDIKSFGAPGVFRDLPAGGTSSAAPQVAGAAATVWGLAPSLTPAQLAALLRATARPVETTSGDPRCGSVQAAPALDFHAAVLGADGAATLPARAEILDSDADGDFDEDDLQEFRDAFIAAGGAIDYGRHDLNGDGRTGGGRDRYDLDASSPPAWTFSQRREVVGLEVLHDENDVRDLDVLCHEAHGPLFGGSTAARDLFAEQFCLPPVEIEVDPPFPSSLLPGQSATLRIRAQRSDLDDPTVSHQPGVHLEFSGLSGTMGAASGTTGLDGAFSTTASLPAAGDFEVTVVARAGAGGPELDRLTVRASRGGTGSVVVDQAVSEVVVSAEACAGRDGEGCVIHFDGDRDFLEGLGAFGGGLGASMSREGTAGFYEGNSASSSADATLSSDVNTTGAPLEVVAIGSAAGTAQRTLGANPAAHAAYSSQGSIFLRFRVIGQSLPYSIEGSGEAIATADAGTGNFVLYRVAPFQFIKQVQSGSFDGTGTLAPGTYELGTGATCAADEPATCDASFSVTFRVGP